MRRTLILLGVLGSLVLGAAGWWRRHPRFGSAWVNRVIDPWLIRQGVVERSAGEIGLIEHVGRTSGVVRITPVHPVATEDGFRIVVPLGFESQWARNVLRAGRCRMQLGEVVHELDKPVMVAPSAIDGIPPLAARLMEWLGFWYLSLRAVTTAPGTLAPASVAGQTVGQPELAPA